MICNDDKHRYDDIINLPHPDSPRHHRMPLIDRAAQFAPFAALTGFGAVITESGRLTEKRQEFTEETKNRLDERMQILLQHFNSHPVVTFTYFVPDTKKEGGAYATASGIVKKMDPYKGIITLDDGTIIPIPEITALTGPIFED